jgi:addiction module HigA family antidote
MIMHDPPHPGEILREDCIKAADLSVTKAAEMLGVSRQALSELLNGHAGISTEMALRLEKMNWSTAEVWLGMQQTYDLWQARHR